MAATLDADGAVTIRNVPSYCHAMDVAVEVPGVGTVVGDVAYGGNWFFITHLDAVPVTLSRVDELTRLTRAIMDALHAQGITGAGGAAIDHVELSGGPRAPGRRLPEFRALPRRGLRPVAVRHRHLRSDGRAATRAERCPVGTQWRQESITGSLFTGWLEQQDGKLIPCIRGTAHVTGESMLLFDPADPFRAGFTATG